MAAIDKQARKMKMDEQLERNIQLSPFFLKDNSLRSNQVKTPYVVTISISWHFYEFISTFLFSTFPDEWPLTPNPTGQRHQVK